MKVEFQIDDALRDRGDLIRIMKGAADFLADRDTDADSEAVAVWRLGWGTDGAPRVALVLRDQDFAHTEQFPPARLTPADRLEYRLIQLWNDVLQQRTHRQLKRVNELIAQMED